MKVTSGKYGGRKLVDNKFEHIRPTADMVKQAVFNKLCDIVPGAVVLDLFCGTGALGIEALSRGAKEVVFADKDRRSIGLTEENLKNLKIEAKTICAGYDETLRLLKGRKFDLIILDPPYKAGLYENALNLIDKYECLAENGVIVCEHDKDIKIEFKPFEMFDERGYGIKVVSYLRQN